MPPFLCVDLKGGTDTEHKEHARSVCICVLQENRLNPEECFAWVNRMPNKFLESGRNADKCSVGTLFHTDSINGKFSQFDPHK